MFDVSLTSVTIQQGGDCPVCGGPVQPPVQTCPDCATPHHQDCWSYNQGCAIFGCAEHAVRPLAVRSVSLPAPTDLCPGCDQAVRGPAVRCACCGTLHHRACFDRDQRCMRSGCPLSGDAHPGEPLPEKILLPQVAMAFFSGLLYFPPIFALWCIFWVMYAAVFLSSNLLIALACYGLVVLGMVVGGMWSDRYNLDLKERAITRSWLIGPLEIVESRIVSLDSVTQLYIGRPGDHVGPVALHAATRLFYRPRITLTPGLTPGSREHGEVQRLLWKLHTFSIAPVAPANLLTTETVRPR